MIFRVVKRFSKRYFKYPHTKILVAITIDVWCLGFFIVGQEARDSPIGDPLLATENNNNDEHTRSHQLRIAQVLTY